MSIQTLEIKSENKDEEGLMTVDADQKEVEVKQLDVLNNESAGHLTEEENKENQHFPSKLLPTVNDTELGCL